MSETFVIPNQLCNLCHALFNDGAELEDSARNNTQTGWQQHHPHKEGLRESSSDGCHLCSIILHQTSRNSYKQAVASNGLASKLAVEESARSAEACLDFTEFKDVFIWDEFWSRGSVYLLIRLCDDANSEESVQMWKILLSPGKPMLEPKTRMAIESYSQSTIHEIRSWVARCVNNHPICALRPSEKAKAPFLPSRLLCIHENSSVQLVETADLQENSVYMTLSCRWPATPGLTLRESTMQQLQRGVAIRELSRVFQDACWLTLTLGCRYIWIDAFCIKQDSNLDWLKESAAMCDVYASSLVNLSASMANPDEGLFIRRNPLRAMPCVIRTNQSYLPEVLIAETSDIHDSEILRHFPLYKRRWVFQERFLAPRVLHFTDVEIIWECASYISSEVYPHGRPAMILDSCWPFLFGSPSDLRAYTCHGGKLSPANLWMSQVEKYSELDLTLESDKLPAVAGFARKMHQASGGELGTYFAGIFEYSFLEQLNWYRDTKSQLAAPAVTCYRPPTWSWASINGPVRFSRHCPEGDRSFVTVLEIVLDHISDEYGGIKSGSLRLKTPLFIATLFKSTALEHAVPSVKILEKTYDAPEGWNEAFDAIIQLHLDDEDACFSGLHVIDVCFIPLTYDDHILPGSVRLRSLHVLLLTPTGEKNGQYKRLGVGCIKGSTGSEILKGYAAQDKLDSALYMDDDGTDLKALRYTIEII